MKLTFLCTNPELRIFTGETDKLIQFEDEEFQNLRDQNGNIVPLFRGDKIPSNEDAGAYRYFKKDKITVRRKPRSNPPVMDLLMELQRRMYYPDYPSRQYAHFANLYGYQPQFVQEDNGKALYLIVPGKDARISISDEVDFKIKDKDSFFCSLISTLNKSFEGGLQGIDKEKSEPFNNPNSLELFVKQDNYDEFNLMVNSFMLGLKNLVESINNDISILPENIRDYFTFWEKSVLARDLVVSEVRKGKEVLIEGRIKCIKVENLSFL